MLTAVAGRVTNISGSSPASIVSEKPVAEKNAALLTQPVVLATVPSLIARHQAEVQAIQAPSVAAAQSAEVSGDPTPAAAPQPQQPYFLYQIQPGDTVSSIAAAYGVTTDSILASNYDQVNDPDLLLPGANLLVPSANGIVYRIQQGDTLSDVASYYHADVGKIVSYNNITAADQVPVGAVLLLPDAVAPAPTPAFVAAAPADDPLPAAVGGSVGDDIPVPAFVPPPGGGSAGYIWPVGGNISQYFGEPELGSYHKAIDIDGFGNYGAPVGAAQEGTVVLAAWDDYGLGYHVVISHPDGSQTVYAHLSDIWVAQGQYVSQGEPVGALGSTGYSTGAHLHFEIRIGGVPVDPLGYLP